MPLCDTIRRSTAPARAGHLASGLLAVLVVAGASVALAGPAAAESRVTITDATGTSVTEVVAGSVVHVGGSGFQSVQGGTGGIYLTFGWVDDAEGGTWRPSAGGATGANYLYAPDVEGAENKGFQRYVAFPGSSTEAAANGGVIAPDGTWTTDLAIPAVQFQAMDREGDAAPVDCAVVQCGFITVGAHGVKNANNETFTPVTFVATAAEVAPTGAATDAATDDMSTDAPTEAITPISADPAEPADPADDASAQRTFILSMVGGFLTLALLGYLGVRRARARGAADPTRTDPTRTDPTSTDPTSTDPTDDDATR